MPETNRLGLERRGGGAIAAPGGGGSGNRLIQSDFYAEGVAATFGESYPLFRLKGKTYREIIEPQALAGADMEDVVFQFAHKGPPLARTGNGTLIVRATSSELFVAADLSGSQKGRELFESVSAGLVTRMSFGFVIEEEELDADTLTFRVKRISRVVDVSAVARPANPYTSIQARSALIDAAGAAKRARALGLLLKTQIDVCKK